MSYIFTIIFISKLVLVEMASLLGIQNQIQAVCALKSPDKTMVDPTVDFHCGFNIKLCNQTRNYVTKMTVA